MPDDVVVEIGAGKGALTAAISESAKKVYSFEIDSELFDFLQEKFDGTNVEFVFEDDIERTKNNLRKAIEQIFAN